MTLLALLACTGGTTGTVDTGTDTTPPTDPGTPSDTNPVAGAMTAELGTNMVTMARVSVVLDEAAQVTLDCVGAGTHQVPETHTAATDEAASESNLDLRGLLAETEYTCTARGMPNVPPVSFTTGSLPASLQTHVLTLEAWEDGAEIGWTLINPWTFLTLNDHHDAYLAVVDMEGRIRWYYPTDEDGIVAFDWHPESRAFWTGGGLTEIYEPTTVDLDGQVQHVTSTEADHDVDWYGDSAFALVAHPSGTCIEERTWADDTLGIRACTGDIDGSLVGYNMNSLTIVEVDDGHVAYTGSATDDRIVKVHLEKQALIWTYGPGHDFTGDIDYSYTHDVRVVPCDDYDVCLSYYDNGDVLQRSDAEIVGLDETAMAATMLREWNEPGWFEPRMGGLEVLEGGNLLIGAGHLELVEPDSDNSQVIEVAEDDSVVWRLRIDPDDSAIYRARRVGPCELFGHTGYCTDQ